MQYRDNIDPPATGQKLSINSYEADKYYVSAKIITFLSIICGVKKLFEDPGEAKGCSTITVIIH